MRRVRREERILFLQWVASLDVHEFLMLVLTFVIAVSAGVQAFYATKMANTVIESEQRRLERSTPRIKFGVFSGGEEEVGFDLTNVSDVAVTITYCFLEKGIPLDSKSSSITSAMPLEYYVMGESTALPATLRSGEVMAVRYARSVHGHAEGRRLRPGCRDSFGNEHKYAWIEHGADSIAIHDDPGEGLHSTEEKQTILDAQKGN